MSKRLVGHTGRHGLGDMVSIGEIRLGPAGPVVTPTAGGDLRSSLGEGTSQTLLLPHLRTEHPGPWAGVAREVPPLTCHLYGLTCGPTLLHIMSELTCSVNTSQPFAQWGNRSPEGQALVGSHRDCEGGAPQHPWVPLGPWPSFMAGPCGAHSTAGRSCSCLRE